MSETGAKKDGTEGRPSGLSSLLRERRILISVGAGGVGKTTTAAALGILGATEGRRTLVLTIDPARRLASSLGLASLDQQERMVPADKMQAAGLDEGSLYAMMLDQKRTFDEVIERHAVDQAAYQRVLANKLYRELSTRLAGGQEYAAMEKLYGIVTADRYELLVLDTPPTVNAFDFLEAPQKMVDLLDSAAVRLFIKSYETAGKLSFRLLTFGSRFVFKRLARFVGGAFLDDLAAFFGDLHAMLPGFRQRAADVTKLLAQEDVGFVIVTSPDRRAINQAILFYEHLKTAGHGLAAFVINRVHPAQAMALEAEELERELAERDVPADERQALASLLLRSHAQAVALAEADRRVIGELKETCGEEHLYVEVPLLEEDVHDIGGLVELGRYLR